jgi:hypothetical protein
MSQAEPDPGAARQLQKGPGAETDLRREGVGRPNACAKEKTILVLGSTFLLITLWVAAPFTAFVAVATAFAQAREDKNVMPRVAALPGGTPEVTPAAFDPAPLPSLDAIDAHADITVFLRSGVPTELQRAALRRAWRMDPAIRDFKGLQENGWNFSGPNSIPGFGELGPEVDVREMVARIFGDTPRLQIARSTSFLRRRP